MISARVHSQSPSSQPAGLPLDRRAGLARQTLHLIRELVESLAVDAEAARRAGVGSGDPSAAGERLEALVHHAQRLRVQGEKLTRAFAVLDRLVPPAPAQAPSAAPVNGRSRAPVNGRPPAAVNGRQPRQAAPSTNGAARQPGAPKAPTPRRPVASSQQGCLDETRDAATAYAVGLKLDGASHEQVEARLVHEFGREDARDIADEAYGRPAAGRSAGRTARQSL